MSNLHLRDRKATGTWLMAWQGGQCPNCKEEMPRGVLVCRYCRSSLGDTTEESPDLLQPSKSG